MRGNVFVSYETKRIITIGVNLLSIYCYIFYRLNGSKYLTDQGIEYDTDWGLWPNILALGVITVIIMIFAYVQLRMMKKLK